VQRSLDKISGIARFDRSCYNWQMKSFRRKDLESLRICSALEARAIELLVHQHYLSTCSNPDYFN